MAIPTDLKGLTCRWRLRTPTPADDLGRRLGVPPLVATLLRQRGVGDRDAARRFLHPRLTDLHEPAALPGVVRAADRIVHALRSGEPIVIYGDYDVDGITGTSILFHAMKTAAPAADVRRYIPHRIHEGYGLNRGSLERIASGGAGLVVTVDCGIGAVEPANAARELGIDLIISDHHAIGSPLPPAHTVVHPRLRAGHADESTYPFGELCGAGVAYKLAWQIARAWCGSERVSDPFRKLLVDLLPLAAVGTIADVVPLVDENRTIAHHGLRRLKHTPFTGLNRLIDAANLRAETIDSYHVGFLLSPRLNASGRMGHAKRAVQLLTTAEDPEATEIASYLNRENERRRATERKILQEAIDMVRARGDDQTDSRAIVLAQEDWHPGVIGIVCSRLVETFGRPTVLLQSGAPDGADSDPTAAHAAATDGQARGSARSIEPFDIYQAFSACREHLDTFGGHAMAAGLRLPTDRIDAFRQAMRAYAAEHISEDDMVPAVDVEAEVSIDELTPEVGEQIERLAPFGRANPSPLLLLRDVRVSQAACPFGREGQHLSIFVEQEGRVLRCIWWKRGDLAVKLPAGRRIDVVGEPKINRYDGRPRVELHLTDLRWRDGAAATENRGDVPDEHHAEAGI